MTVADTAQPETAATGAPRPSRGFWASCCGARLYDCLPTGAMHWFRMAVGVFVAAQTMVLGLTINLTPPDDRTTLLLLQLGMLAATLVVMLLLGLPLAAEATAQLRRRRLTMELLFLAGILAAFTISIQSLYRSTGPVYFEVVNVLLVVYSSGHALNAYTQRLALRSMRPFTRDLAHARLVPRDPGAPPTMVDAATLRPGDAARVFPGELIPIDGTITSGTSLVRQTTFTGEWSPRILRPGDSVLAGTACEDGTLTIEATSSGTARRVDALASLIESARSSPTRMQRQADRFVQWFLPIVALIAYATFVYWTFRTDWHTGLFNALAVVLVACPCAAGLATPLAIWSTLLRLASRGLILRSGDAIERLASIDSVIFDKTGTLSDDSFAVVDVDIAGDSDVLAMVRAVERHSTHPVARALRSLDVPPDAPSIEVLETRILPGQGIEATVRTPGTANGSHILRLTRDDATADSATLRICVTLDDRPVATITLAEHLRDSAQAAIAQLQRLRIPTQIMTGDTSSGPAAVPPIAPTTASLAPEQKHARILSLRDGTVGGQNHPLFVGDGLNDAAAMAASHASIALASGADITIETASGTLHGGDLTLIPHAITLSRRAVATVRANLLWAVAYNAIGIAAAATGHLHPVLAAVLMMLSSLVVAWRSHRLATNEPDPVAPDPSPARPPIAHPALPAPRRWLLALHAVCLLLQTTILTQLAGLSIPPAGGLLLASALLTCFLLRIYPRLPASFDMTLAMLTIGGLGMNVGWWLDAGLSPAISADHVATCCARALDASTAQSSHWMYWLMLLFGVPAMYLIRRIPERFSLKRWCCVGPLILGVPAMCLGMWAGAQLASHMTAIPPALQVFASYALMMLGMAVGMLIPHAIDPFLVPSPVPPGPIPRT